MAVRKGASQAVLHAKRLLDLTNKIIDHEVEEVLIILKPQEVRRSIKVSEICRRRDRRYSKTK